MKSKFRSILFLLPGLTLVAASTSCGSGDPPASAPQASFLFNSVINEPVNVLVTADDQPVAYARVEIASHRTSEAEVDEPAETFTIGFTDEEGLYTGAIYLPTRHDEVDLVINKRNFTGPYTDEDLRTSWGAFAPSSRILVTRQQLSEINIQLTEVTK